MEQKRISLTITCLMGFVLFSWGQLLPHQNLRNWNTVFEDDMNSFNQNRWWSFDYPVNSHFPSPNEGINYFSSNYSQNYHWYSMLWDKNKIVWYFDRQPVRIEANTCGGEGIQHPLYIYINAALKPITPNYSLDYITNNSLLPQNMYVDQVNVYQIDCMDKNVVVNDISNFSTYNYSLKRSISLTNATTLPSNSDIVLYAREFIELDNGFSVPVGTSLYLDVFDSCE